MPLVRQPTRVTLTFRDRARKATSSFHMGDVAGSPPDPMALANPNVVAPFSFVQELYNNMQDVSNCAGIGYQVTYSWLEQPFAPAYDGNPNVERKGVWSFNLSGSVSKSIFTVPGIDIACQAPDGKSLIYTVDAAGEPTFGGTLAGDMQSIHDKLRNGATMGAVTFPVTDADGNDFAQMFAAYQQTRSSKGRG